MKRNILLAAGAACAVAAAVQVAAAGPTVQPGLYETTTRLVKANMPGMPASAMKAMMAKTETKKQCITPEDVKNGVKLTSGCKATQASTAGGKINVVAQCSGGRTQRMVGTYTPTTFNYTMEAGSAGGAGSMTFNQVGRRIGDCTGDE